MNTEKILLVDDERAGDPDMSDSNSRGRARLGSDQRKLSQLSLPELITTDLRSVF